MPILNITLGVTGLVNVVPRIIYIQTNDTLAQVTAAGYLNAAREQGFSFNDTDMAVVSTKTAPSATTSDVGWLEVSLAGGNVTLVPTDSPGNVNLPTVANAIVHAVNTVGGLSTDAASIFNLGNISAGQSGTAGYLASFPATLARGSLRLVAANNAGDTVTQITNASQAAARVYTIPDGGQAASNFLITDSAGTQTIATGSLALTLGNITAAAGNIAATLGSVTAGTTMAAGTGISTAAGNIVATTGNLVAGSSGHAGTVTSFPATGGNGTLILAAVNAGGAFNMTISNAVIGQSTVVSVPDPGAATANFLLDAGAANLITDYSQMLELKDFLLAAGGGAFSVTRTAAGDWAQLHATAADTSILGFDVTEQLRAAASKGFKLNSYDVIYSIATDVLVAHTTTLSTTVYANNVAVSVTSNAVTGTLATATQANPYVTNIAVSVPAFSNPAAGTAVKQVIELSVQTSATTVYTIKGINLRFTKSIS